MCFCLTLAIRTQYTRSWTAVHTGSKTSSSSQGVSTCHLLSNKQENVPCSKITNFLNQSQYRNECHPRNRRLQLLHQPPSYRKSQAPKRISNKKLKAAFESENPVLVPVTPVVTQTGTISTPILVVDPTPELVIVNEPVTKPHISHKRKEDPEWEPRSCAQNGVSFSRPGII